MRRVRGWAVAALVLLTTGEAATQQADPAMQYGTGWVDDGHWSIDAVRRLAGLGLTPAGIDLGRRTRTEQEIARAFEHAARAASGDSTLHVLATGYLARFRTELGREPSRSGEALNALRGSAITAGYSDARGRLRTGWGYSFGVPNTTDWSGGEPMRDERGLRAAVELRANAGERLSVHAVPSWRDGDLELARLYAAGRIAGVVAWAGRREHALGSGVRSGLVLTELRADGVGVQSAAPFRLPWIFSGLGPVTLDLSVSMVDTDHSFDDVFFILNRGTVAPHERLRLGLTRAAFFGGDGNDEIGWFDVFSLLVGKHAGEVGTELDNQVVALDASYRPPVDRWIPLRLYLEWGFEDSAGAWKNVPGFLAGIEVPAVPGLPAVAVDVELAGFARSCCGNPIWYRHATFHDGWTTAGRPLGHPLGGHGQEWSAGVRVTALDARFNANGRVILRRRGEENLYWPAREGRSTGFQGGADWLVAERVELGIEGLVEAGDGWRESGIDIGLRLSM